MPLVQKTSTRLLSRWLEIHGAAVAEIPAMMAPIHRRMASLPAPIARLAPAAVTLIDLLPVFVLGRRQLAHRLDESTFAAFERALQHHPNPILRSLFTLMRFAPLEALYPDEPPREADMLYHCTA